MSQFISRQILENSIGWDVENWGRSLEFFKRHFDDGELQEVTALEVGCGAQSGGIGLWLVSEGAHVICTSNLDVQCEVAKFYEDAGYSDAFSFESWDASRAWHGEKVDLICLKSVLGGLWRLDQGKALASLLREIYGALNPGGRLLFAENLVASPLHKALRARFGAGRNDWHYFSMEDLADTINDAGFEISNSESTGFLGAFGRSERQRRYFGRFDGMICPFLPAKLHYVGYGMAVKK